MYFTIWNDISTLLFWNTNLNSFLLYCKISFYGCQFRSIDHGCLFMILTIWALGTGWPNKFWTVVWNDLKGLKWPQWSSMTSIASNDFNGLWWPQWPQIASKMAPNDGNILNHFSGVLFLILTLWALLSAWNHNAPKFMLYAWNHNTPNIFLLGTIMPPNIFPVDKNFTAQDGHSIRNSLNNSYHIVHKK